ncbi:MAG: isoprenylcysteine carboxylmethyltransferase family protein, partial [Clostridia bacterium]|nr:isoprenylcysteine carboxylmethyltransferase family protein [Clostridia bacterium]
MKLAAKALTLFLFGFLLVGGLLFLPAGTIQYSNGWLFLILLFVPIFALGIVLLIKSPSLLEKRLNGKEKQATQKGVVALSGLLFFVGFVIAGLDFRFGWSHVPMWVVIVASVVLLISYGLYGEVMRENAYL